MCLSDPLHSALTTTFINFYKYLIPNSEGIGIELHLNIGNDNNSNTCFWCLYNSATADNKNFGPISIKCIGRTIRKCIKCYKIINLTNRLSINTKCLHLTFTCEYLQRIENIWKKLEIFNFNEEGSFSSVFERSLQSLSFMNKAIEYDTGLIHSVKKETINFNVFLDNAYFTNEIIRWLLNDKKQVNSNTIKLLNQNSGAFTIGMTEIPTELQSNLSKLSLTQYRKLLIGNYVRKILEKIGCQFDSETFSNIPSKYLCNVFIANEYEDNENEEFSLLNVKVGNVLTSDFTLRKNETIESFFNRRLENLEKKKMDIPNQQNLDEDEGLTNSKIHLSNSALAQFTINYDFLSPNPVTQLDLDSKESYESMNDHESFLITYNYSRLVAILKKFHEKVASGEYPSSIPSIDYIDFSLLNKRTEIGLTQMLLEWPRVLETTVDFLRQELNIDVQLKFMKELAYRFNSFYTQNSVLAKPSSIHEFELMFTRIYLLLALRQVFHDFFDFMLTEFETDS